MRYNDSNYHNYHDYAANIQTWRYQHKNCCKQIIMMDRHPKRIMGQNILILFINANLIFFSMSAKKLKIRFFPEIIGPTCYNKKPPLYQRYQDKLGMHIPNYIAISSFIRTFWRFLCRKHQIEQYIDKDD